MRLTQILALAAALTTTGVAAAQQPGAAPKPATPQPAAPAPAPTTPGQPPTTPTPLTPPAAPTPPAPAAIPVPDMPVIKTSEIEGILIEDMKFGDGYEVKPNAAVVMHYHGTLKADPTKIFDSSFEKGDPLVYPLNMLVQGWQKAVPGMKVGGIRRITVPAALGYGAQERPPGGPGRSGIPANSDLVFVIQLVDTIHIEEVKAGEGAKAEGLFVPVTKHVIKDGDGKEIERADAVPYVWLPGEMSDASKPTGFDAMIHAIEGMQAGGKRKVYIPKEFNVSPAQLGVTRPQKVALNAEIELVAFRNLPAQPGRRR